MSASSIEALDLGVIDPTSVLLMLMHYHKKVALDVTHQTPATPHPFERVVLGRYSELRRVEDREVLIDTLNLLVKRGLAETLPSGEFALTSRGRTWSTALIEYEVQVAGHYIEQAFEAVHIVDCLGDSETLRVLDVGCGTGVSEKALVGALRKARGRGGVLDDYHGLDVSFEMLEVGKLISDTGSFVRGHALQLPYQDGSFDLVFSKGVAMYFDLSSFLSESLRVAREDGRLVVITPAFSLWITMLIFNLRRLGVKKALQQLFPLTNGALQWLGRRPISFKGSTLTGITETALERAVKALGQEVDQLVSADLPYSTHPVLVLSLRKRTL